VTTGAPQRAYGPDGANGHSVRAFLAPVERTVALCGMHFLPPFCVHGALGISDAEIERGARDYAAVLEGLRAGVFDHRALANAPRLEAPVGDRAEGTV